MNENTPLAVDTGRGVSINYKGKSLYSRYNPPVNPERIAGTVKMEEETLYIVPSPLFCYGISTLLDRIPENSFILGIEIDQALMKLSTDSDLFIRDNRFQTVRLDRREQLKQMIESLGIWKYRRCLLIPLNNGYNLYKEQYDFLFDFASFHLNTFWRNRLTINKLGKLWINNIFNNLIRFNSMKPDNRGKPVVICGAGPSLDETVALLKENREYIYLMAVDTALPSLIEAGIVPDLVYALESQFYNLGDFHNTGNLTFDLLADITSYPQICRNNRGRVFFSYTTFFSNQLLNRLSRSGLVSTPIPPLGSVGVAAVYTALHLFTGELFLTGLDFSYTPGKSHSKGSPFSQSRLRTVSRFKAIDSWFSEDSRKMLEIPGKKNGTFIKTDSVLLSYGRLIKDILSGESRAFDLSWSGFPLGIPVISSEDFKFKVRKSPIVQDQQSDRSERMETMENSPVVFLNNERTLLRNLIEEWELFSSSSSDDIPRSLIEALIDVDYVYIDFPDRLPHPVKDISFVARAVKSARDYLNLLSRISGPTD